MGVPMTLRCERCTTERREAWSRTGALLYRTYVYPTGYQQHWGGNFPTKDDFRQALMSIRKTPWPDLVTARSRRPADGYVHSGRGRPVSL
jgi:hypothetical protein